MTINIEQLTISESDLVFEWILKLLNELGEESDDLGTLDREAVLNDWRNINDGFFVLIARNESGSMLGILTLAIGFAIYANGNYGVINEMYVAPEARSQGIGEALIKAAIVLGREHNWSRIDVTAPESERWLRSRRFYEKQGFTFAGPKLKIML
ncbi:MAG: GNAT family N-acetyltransferase [Anaerolineales bacterium]|nr:GNAT family N-acetyltransferase [Anaerolineales bacterium]